MRRFEESSDTQVDASYAQDPTKNHKEMDLRDCHTGLSQNQSARGQRKEILSGVMETPIPATRAQPRMQHAHSVANKDTLNEPASKRKG